MTQQHQGQCALRGIIRGHQAGEIRPAIAGVLRPATAEEVVAQVEEQNRAYLLGLVIAGRPLPEPPPR